MDTTQTARPITANGVRVGAAVTTGLFALLMAIAAVLRRVEHEGCDRTPGHHGPEKSRPRWQAARLRAIAFVGCRNEPGRPRDRPFDRGRLDPVLHRFQVAHVRSEQEAEKRG